MQRYDLVVPGTGPTDEMVLPVVHVYGTSYEQVRRHHPAFTSHELVLVLMVFSVCRVVAKVWR